MVWELADTADTRTAATAKPIGKMRMISPRLQLQGLRYPPIVTNSLRGTVGREAPRWLLSEFDRTVQDSRTIEIVAEGFRCPCHHAHPRITR